MFLIDTSYYRHENAGEDAWFASSQNWTRNQTIVEKGHICIRLASILNRKLVEVIKKELVFTVMWLLFDSIIW